MINRGLKGKIQEVLHNPESEHFRAVNGIIGLFAVVSLALALATIIPYFHRYEPALFWIDWVITLFFTFEYTLRFWIAEEKWGYVRSPLGLIDLLSFIPTYLGLGSFGFLKAVRFLRIARLSRVANVTNVSKVLLKKE